MGKNDVKPGKNLVATIHSPPDSLDLEALV